MVLCPVQPEGLYGFWKREGDQEPEIWGKSGFLHYQLNHSTSVCKMGITIFFFFANTGLFETLKT